VSDDWSTRSAGAQIAVRLQTQGEIDTYKFANSSVGRISLDTTNKPEGTSGSMKIAVLGTDTEGGATARIPYGVDYVNGDTFWVSFRVWAPPSFVYQPWSTANGHGPKYSINSLFDASNQTWEVVLQQTYNRNLVEAYYQSTEEGDFVNIDVGASTSCSGSDTKTQPSPQQTSTTPLSGTDPDTGAAWSSCQQARARFGGLHSSVAGADDYRRGLGDPIDGGVRHIPNEWMTLTTRIDVGEFGAASSRVRIWVAREGQSYRQVADARDIILGGDGEGPFNATWLTAFTTGRTTAGRQITGRSNNITGATLHTAGLSATVGVGTLEYNATTQRFRWKGAGGAYGTARGFSSANGKLLLNVIESGNNYIVVEVDTATLPTSGTHEDTVTIADGRPDTQINYADFIVSTSAIPAPGGYMPLPAWLENVAVNEWVDLGVGTRISSVDPSPAPSPEGVEGPEAKSTSWTGYAWDKRVNKAYCVAQGGHGAYSGNEVDMLDLEMDAPAWVQLKSPYLTPPSGSSVAYYVANQPSSRHSYNATYYNEAEDKVYNFGGAAWETGGEQSDIFTYDVATNTYSAQGSNASMGAFTMYNQGIGEDPVTGDLYMFGGNGSGTQRLKWTRATKTFSTLSGHGSSPSMYYASAAFDTLRRRILIGGGGGGDGGDAHHVYDVAANTMTSITFTGSQSGLITNTTSATGLVYVEVIDRFMMRTHSLSGGTIYEIHPTTWAIEPFATTGGTSIPALSPSRPRYTKFYYLPLLGGIYMNGNYDSNSWFLKLHSVEGDLEGSRSVLFL
jgi:hypothetical protein